MTAGTSESGDPVEDQRELVAQVIDALPDWITQLIQINDLIAEQMGVVQTDFHCLHELHRNGPATASVLAKRVGLTSGSTSRMIDRLADAGCVKRVPDLGDRRRILIEPTGEGLDRITAYYAGLTAQTKQILGRFDAAGLRTLLGFIQASQDSAAAEVEHLRARLHEE